MGDHERQISVASFTHFGYKKDLKSQPTYYSVRALAASGMINDIFVLDLEDPKDVNPELFEVPLPGGKFVPRIFYLLERFVPSFDARYSTIEVFDRFTKRHVGNELILHSFPHLTKTLRTARDSGTTTVVYASSSHPSHVESLRANKKDTYTPEIDAKQSERILRGYDLADYILCLSEYSKQTFIENGFSSERLINIGPLGTDLEHFSPTTPPNDEFVVISVSNMTELKGTRYLLNAWESLDIPNSRLMLCGTMNEEVRETIGPRLDALENVEHVGYVDNPHDYFREASVFVHPSLTESFGKVIVEAMASSLPVIITEHGPRELIGDAGFVVPIKDPTTIAQKIRHLYENQDEARRMGQRGREIMEENTWEDFSERVKEAHRTILEREGYEF